MARALVLLLAVALPSCRNLDDYGAKEPAPVPQEGGVKPEPSASEAGQEPKSPPAVNESGAPRSDAQAPGGAEATDAAANDADAVSPGAPSGDAAWPTDAGTLSTCGFDVTRIVDDEVTAKGCSLRLPADIPPLPNAVFGGGALPTITNSLYAVHDGGIFRIDESYGAKQVISETGWQEASNLAVAGGLLYLLNANALAVVEPLTGSVLFSGPAIFAPEARLLTFGGALMAVENDGVHLVDPTTGLKRPVLGARWSKLTSAAVLDTSLYFVESGYLHALDFCTCTDRILRDSQDWVGSTFMATTGSALYIIQSSKLYRADLDFGTWSYVSHEDLTSATAMTALEGSLYVVLGAKIVRYDVPGSGKGDLLNAPVGDRQEWFGTRAFAAMP